MKQIYKQAVIIDEHTRNEWVWELIDRHRMVIEVQYLVNVILIFGNLLSCPSFSSKSPEPKLAVIEVDYSKHISRSILLNFLHLDVAIWLPSELFLKGLEVSFEAVLLHIILPVGLFSHRDRILRIVGDSTFNQWVLGLHFMAFC